jgi:hypothetical protein
VRPPRLQVRAPRRRGGWIALLSAAALAGAIVAFVRLDPRAGTAREAARPVNLRATEPIAAAAPEESDEQAWKTIATAIGTAGALKDGVYTVTVPRTDLAVTIHGSEVPAAAGLESRFGFYRCGCGRINVVGQFVTGDYESNDVVDALRKPAGDAEVDVASVGPLLLYEKPRLTLVRFQGEAPKSIDLARTIKSALDRTGKARAGEQPIGRP